MTLNTNPVTDLYNLFTKHPRISTDSRNVAPDSIFFALRGASFDGNRFAAAALEQGAAYAVVDDPTVAVSDRYRVVDDTLATLQHLALYHRRVLGIPILAITGSNGKTTTKELAARVLACNYNVSVTRGNLNNHIGVPLTLLAMKRDTEFGIVEMGASHCGEIEQLCSIAQPDFGLITNIGRAHLEGFGGPEGVMRGKGELYDYLAAHHGVAFYLAESSELSEMVRQRPQLQTVAYSVRDAGQIKNHLVGDYNRYNIAAAAALGRYFEVDPAAVVAAIGSYEPDNHRSQRMETRQNTLILDCYNANPSSMHAAIENFAQEAETRPKAVILGDMLELGRYASDEHLAVLQQLAENRIREQYLVGANFMAAAEATGIPAFPNCEALRAYLVEHPLSDRLILIKGSHSIGLERVVDLL